MMNHKILLVILLALLPAVPLSAQTSDAEASQRRADVSSTDRLAFDLDAVTFLRDAEFFLPYVKGYTACGFRFTPLLRYRANARTTLRGGVMLTGVAGTEGLWKAEPVFAIDYTPRPWITLTMGTIEGSTAHLLGEPMYDPERWFFDYKEDGLQLRTTTRRWRSDTWLNWEHFLEPWTPDQERFSLGSRHEWVPLGEEQDRWYLSVPFSFLGSHRGGQFSTLDTCIETIFNEHLGIKAQLPVADRAVLRADMPFYFFQNKSPEPHTAFTHGWGCHPQLIFGFSSQSAQSWWQEPLAAGHRFELGVGYWYGHHYQSARGSYMYQSVSWFDTAFCAPERHMITVTADYEHEFEALTFVLDATAYYDPDCRKTDFVFGVILRLKQRFAITVGTNR